ncbi:hypothetical protein [uncultured Trichococcus sp.]|uniref:hypothetical protein n=1 Tax=uncultured Trichococcus sp. TaxID=189665 RepID=UPI002A18E1CF|nr:hypothetical protein [uncultured Trichococcus sp.]
MKIIFDGLIPGKARHEWEKVIIYACGFQSSKTLSNEKSELVQPSLHCSAIIFELIGPCKVEKKQQEKGKLRNFSVT